jgi:hypothetical protein
VTLEQRAPKDHPLRALRALVEGILANMSAVFDERYSHTGRPSIPPEQVPFQRVLEWGLLVLLVCERA